MARKYQMRRRAERVEETRLRITEAAMELHGTVGPARTTVSAVAERAGVDRLTVYRHFPDEEALFQACTGHWLALHPFPDPADWASIEDPDARLERALRELYGWYRRTHPMMENFLRDGPVVPALAGRAAEWERYRGAVVQALLHGRPVRGRRRALQGAAIAHATDLTTWLSLSRTGLDDAAAVALMTAFVATVADA